MKASVSQCEDAVATQVHATLVDISADTQPWMTLSFVRIVHQQLVLAHAMDVHHCGDTQDLGDRDLLLTSAQSIPVLCGLITMGIL